MSLWHNTSSKTATISQYGSEVRPAPSAWESKRARRTLSFSPLSIASSLPRLYRFAFMPIPLADLQIHSEMPADLYQPGVAQLPLILARRGSSRSPPPLPLPPIGSSHRARLHPAVLFFSLPLGTSRQREFVGKSSKNASLDYLQLRYHPRLLIGGWEEDYPCAGSFAIALLAIIGMCYAARLDSTYLPPSSAGSAGGAELIHPPSSRHGADGPVKYSGPVGPGSFGGPGSPGGPSGSSSFSSPSGHGGSGGFGFGSSSSAYASDSGLGGHGDQKIPIISYSNENAGDGNYHYSYEAGNGINVQETGHKQGESESVSGSFSYTGPDGMQYSITYTADEYGFHPQGAHLPTPPPIPPEIQRGVELALAAEARGENQDGGSERYSHGGSSGYPSGGGGGYGGSVYQGPSSYQTSSSGGYQY